MNRSEVLFHLGLMATMIFLAAIFGLGLFLWVETYLKTLGL